MSPFDALAELTRELRMSPAQAVEFLVAVREDLAERWPVPPGNSGPGHIQENGPKLK